MITVTNLQEISVLLAHGSVVSWGNFDGVHLGHQALAAVLAAKAADAGLPSVAVTFDPHPALFFSSGARRHCITDTADKLTLLERLGLDYTLVLPFDAAFAAQTPRAFAQGVLAGALRAKYVVLGHDLGFGQNRSGGFETLQKLGRELAFEVQCANAVTLPGQNTPVSSTGVREAIKNGNMDKATAMLGRVHSVHANVRHGARRGTGLLGFPTANIDPGPLLLPPHGVYACLAKVDGGFYAAATNLGVNPSFGGDTPSLEAHMLDFEGDLYGKDLRLYFLSFIRPEQKFDSIDALKAQIGKDVQNTRQIVEQARAQAAFSALFPL